MEIVAPLNLFSYPLLALKIISHPLFLQPKIFQTPYFHRIYSCPLFPPKFSYPLFPPKFSHPLFPPKFSHPLFPPKFSYPLIFHWESHSHTSGLKIWKPSIYCTRKRQNELVGGQLKFFPTFQGVFSMPPYLNNLNTGDEEHSYPFYLEIFHRRIRYPNGLYSWYLMSFLVHLGPRPTCKGVFCKSYFKWKVILAYS